MLTKDQKRVLTAVIAAIKAKGIPPSLPELEVTLGLSASYIRKVQVQLEELGYVKRFPRTCRGIAVLRGPRSKVAA
jgi:SOS-response transcriptional repressor LexA